MRQILKAQKCRNCDILKSVMNKKIFWTCLSFLLVSSVLAGDASGVENVKQAVQEVPLAHKMTLLALQIGLILFAAKLVCCF